ncbi:MAG: DUF4136 domain-containing protein [Labilithrix sp.]|nr:DUF4136 domain-containing protein [Labilithrix sp.]MCW5809702.1 DUF4136 domain-containing protein [Labilithrix sp.]
MRLPRIVCVVLVFVLAACAPSKDRVGTMQVTTHSAVISSVSGHKTYAFEATAPTPDGTVQWADAPQTLAIIRERIEGEMRARGYVLDPDPELLVRISLGVKKVLEEPKGMAAQHGAPSMTNDVTELHIDVFDRSNGGHLFHGSASDELHHREPDPDRIAKQVRLIMEPVPPTSR